MYTLPEKANLRFLRSEAKNLLATLRALRPAASLADAQRYLAEQYGFRSWTDLKAEVERRRAGLATADPRVAARLAEVFGLGEVAGEMIQVSSDFMGGTWRLVTATGSWAMRPVFGWIQEDRAQLAVGLMEAAAAAGVQTPKAVRSVRGRLVEGAGDRFWRADEWMDLGRTPARPVSRSVAAAAGHVLGVVHRLALPAPQPDLGTPSARPSEPQWRALVTRAHDAGAKWARMLEEAIPPLVELASVATDVDDEATILTHRDFAPGNTRTRRGGGLTVLHWEFAGGMSPRQELGNSMTQWTFGPGDEINVEGARAFMDAYVATGGGVRELDLGMFSKSVEMHLDWMYGRVVHALDERQPDRQQFALRELSGLLGHARSREQYERLLNVIASRAVAEVAR